MFDPQLIGAHDFSVDNAGRGMVTARRTNAQGVIWTGPHAITADANGVWIPDDVRDRPNLDDLDGAHMVTTIVGDAHAVGWIEKPRTPGIFEYNFQTTAWGMVPGFVDPFIAESTRAGNVIELVAGALTQKWAVVIEISQVIGEPNNLRINQLDPGSSWRVTSEATPLEQSTLKINPNGGVLTGDRKALVYTAQLGDTAYSQMFVSRRVRGKFAPGAEVSIEGVAGDADLTEPWINADCTTLYFRRADTTWMATAVDDAGAAP